MPTPGPKYAERTEVPSDRSRSEIERTLTRYGATSFAYGWQGRTAVVGFEIADRKMRFELTLPDRGDREFTMTNRPGVARTASAAENMYEQAVRQRWRALALVIKAKLEAVAAGITTVESEFLAHIVLPDGRTVGDHTAPRIAEAYELGTVPPMLAITSGGDR
jgi:hypothetical protein